MTNEACEQSESPRWIWGPALFCLAAVLYLPSLHHSFIWDDEANVVRNTALLSLDGLRRIWFEPGAVLQYYPLTYTTFWIEHRLWGGQPFGYHLVNLLLHAINTVLVWRVFGRLHMANAWLAAALFACHPLQVESVAWVSERKNVLAAFFYLCAMLAYLEGSFRHFDTFAGESDKTPTEVPYRLAVGLFVCALLSKTAACTLPVVLLVILWWKRPRLEWRDASPLVPMFGLGLLAGLMTIWVERKMGTQGADWAISALDRTWIAARAVWFYAGRIVWPFSPSFVYARWPTNGEPVWVYLCPMAVLAVAAGLWAFRSRIGKAPLAAAIAFVMSLAPALGFINFYFMKYSFVADRFQYWAGAVLIGSMAALLKSRARWLAVVWLAALLPATWHHQKAFRNEETIWRDTIQKDPLSWMAHNNLGNVLARDDKLEEALGHFRESLRINPDHISAHVNYGNALAHLGRMEEAVDVLNDAVRFRPDYANAHYALGTLMAKLGQSDTAIAHFMKAVELDPNHADAHYNLGIALARQGRTVDALQHFAEALSIRPDFEKARVHLERAMAEVERQTSVAGGR